MMTIEKGFSNDLFLQFEYFGICLSCLIISYMTLWKLALLLNVCIILAIAFAFILMKASDNF